MCVHDGLCFRYTALINHRSVIQQTTSYATGQTVCTFISDHLSDGHAVIGWMMLMFSTGVCVEMHGAMVLFVV